MEILKRTSDSLYAIINFEVMRHIPLLIDANMKGKFHFRHHVL